MKILKLRSMLEMMNSLNKHKKLDTYIKNRRYYQNKNEMGKAQGEGPTGEPQLVGTLGCHQMLLFEKIYVQLCNLVNFPRLCNSRYFWK